MRRSAPRLCPHQETTAIDENAACLHSSSRTTRSMRAHGSGAAMSVNDSFP